MRGGEEHRVWPAPDNTRYWKATYPGCAGFTVISIEDIGGPPDLTTALPLEYLERLLLQNQLFGDEIRLEGVAVEGGKTVIITSQPVLIGEPANEEDITRTIRKSSSLIESLITPGMTEKSVSARRVSDTVWGCSQFVVC